MEHADDTICAISTPAGTGGIAVIRISGPQAVEIADSVWQGKPLAGQTPRTAHLGNILDRGHNDELLDQAVAVVFRAPHSFTGDDVVEMSVHGSRYVQRRLLQLLIEQGCRLAEPGEFTRRAFANGNLDLAQAEAVADVIAADSRAAHRLAASQMKGEFSKRLASLRDRLLTLASLLELELDFSEEEVEFASREQLRHIAAEIHSEVSHLHQSFSAGNAIKEGIPVAIAGPTNAGKSSLLNLLLGENRAIVSDIHGTTRDTVEGSLAIGDYAFRLIDTAGFRHTDDPIETLGIDRSRQTLRQAAIRIAVLDANTMAAPADFLATLGHTGPGHTEAPSEENSHAGNSHDETPLIFLLNKTDLNPDIAPLRDLLQTHFPGATVIPFSALTADGLDLLLHTLSTIADTLAGNTGEDTLLVTNIRHAQALSEAADSTAAILRGLALNLPGDLIAQDLRATIATLSTITGTLTTPDILATIFSRFCIGK